MKSVNQDLSDRITQLLRAAGKGTRDVRPESFGFEAEFRRSARVKRRGYSQRKKLEIFRRDHFIDRYSGERLFFPGALLLLGKLFPGVFPTPGPDGIWRTAECHWIYWRLTPSVDHYQPVMRAPDGVDVNSDDNLVTTSMMINTAKDVWTRDEVPEQIRFELIPLDDVQREDWDGMLQWALDYARIHSELLDEPGELSGWMRTARQACV